MRSNTSSMGNTVGHAIGTIIKMQQCVRIRLRTVRHVVGDKMLEIPDSLNERDKQAVLDASSRPEFEPERRKLVEVDWDCLAIANTALKYERYRSRELSTVTG